jgi:NDP-sugar pyrophosphorylase family protein
MLNIVVPMAGAGSRFSKAGFLDPKPLIKINGVPMIRIVIENLKPSRMHRFIFICQASHVRDYDLKEKLITWAPGSLIIEIDGVTEGAACTVLKARKYIDSDDPLMICNSDQFVESDINCYLNKMDDDCLDGIIMTMKASDAKWSYAKIDSGFVVDVVEKKVISDEATVGIYNFKSGADFVQATEEMINKNLRVNGEFYVAPVYRELVLRGKKIGIFNVGEEGNGMHGLGIPSDLNLFEQSPLCKAVTRHLT